MIAEFNLYGVFIPAGLVWALVAFALSAVVRRVFRAVGLYRFVWHRPLFDFAILIILLGAVTALARTFP